MLHNSGFAPLGHAPYKRTPVNDRFEPKNDRCFGVGERPLIDLEPISAAFAHMWSLYVAMP